ncbi:MAG: transglycosylase domain-containing protein [Polaromonas sp.]|uniref:transglycosylase domain-containing protein n=1 Tax=Polaromonas sp. TaxID=1869339 RepID=UPI002486E342|nr:transglycosylase domain-containing protein [Polaromonas sp.]MDI1268668.1 transglycosylase domain-containing protein [Polaromonas sp.]
MSLTSHTIRSWSLKRSLFALLLIAACARPAWAATTFDEVKREYRPSDTLVLDRSGEVIQRLRTDSTVRRGQWVALPDISPALRTALVLSEDKRFYEHSGVDWRAVSSAAWGNLWNTKTRGASTLSMQLAGLLDEDWRASAGGRSITQKIGQTVSAQLLERSWRKDQILEAYLNLVPFRGELVGIDALSRTLFGKAAHGLDEREAAVAAALVRAPNAKAVQVSQRACGVLKAMQAPTKTDCAGLDLFASAALQRRAFDATEGMAPHLARRLLALHAPPSPQPSPKGRGSKAGSLVLPPLPRGEGWGEGSSNLGGHTLTSTLRAPLQRFAVQTLTQQLRELRGRHVEDGAIVVLDNASGEVLAWVGSSGELSDAAEVDGVLALRQPGSTLKPFLYAQAIAERRITAASLLEDSSSQIPTAGGLYIPQNYDRQFKGLVSSRTALGASLNVPAVRTLVMVSPDAFHKQLRAVGLPLRETGDYYGYSLALGSSEVSLLALANAYRALANGGRYGAVSFGEPSPLPSPQGRGSNTSSTPASRSSSDTLSSRERAGVRAAAAFRAAPAIDPGAAFIVSDILSDPLARARTFGTDSILATRFWTAVKTGTSKDMRDNWAVGFSQRYTVGVWVGNASGAPMWDVSGTSGAAPVWAALMNYLHQSEPSRAPAPPAGVMQKQVTFADAAGTPIEAARSEWFLRGTEQALFAIYSGAAGADRTRAGGEKGLKKSNDVAAVAARITTPANGTIVALDPDIPPNRQRVSFSAQGGDLRWLMDGKPFARGAQTQWLPWPGRHVVQLVDDSGEVLDEIRIEVRGAGVRETKAGSGASK